MKGLLRSILMIELFILQPDFLRSQNWRKQDGQLSLYSQTLYKAWQEGSLYACDNGHLLFQDVGTVDAWRDVENGVALHALLRYNKPKGIIK